MNPDTQLLVGPNIGAYRPDDIIGRGFTGQMDNIMVLDIALDADEVAAMEEAQRPLLVLEDFEGDLSAWTFAEDAGRAMIADDPDAPVGTFVHWVLHDLPPDVNLLSEGIVGVGTEGVNSFGETGYGGPCPPKGSTHRYFFKLYALDKPLNLDSGATKEDVEQSMKGHILAQGEIMGKYGR